MCTLRAWGKHFDVDHFLAGSGWKASAAWRRGAYRYKKRMAHSGFNLGISDASWKKMDAQARDAIRWLQKNGDQLRRLRRSPGLEGVVLDFPARSRLGGPKKIVAQEERFPAALLKLAAKFDLDIALSIYE